MSADAPTSDGAWAWWQTRRLRYNVALGLAGWAAYGLMLALNLAFGQPLWRSLRDGLSTTLFLGIGFLVLMGIANICYLAGPALEAWLRPADTDQFRKSAYALGFWGSIAVPFIAPALNLAVLIGNAA